MTHAEFSYPMDVTLGFTQAFDNYTSEAGGLMSRRTTHHGGDIRNGAGNAADETMSSGNWSLLVVDSQRVRRVTFPAQYVHLFWGMQAQFRDPLNGVNETTTFGHAKLHGVKGSGMVTTVAGQAHEGAKDGHGSEAEFNKPEGIAMDASGRMFVVDSGNCRLRRLTYASQVRWQ